MTAQERSVDPAPAVKTPKHSQDHVSNGRENSSKKCACQSDVHGPFHQRPHVAALINIDFLLLSAACNADAQK